MPFKLNKKKSNEVQRLQEKHHIIIQLAALGFKGTDIAETVGVTPQTVYNILGSANAKQLLGLLRGSRESDIVNIKKELKTLEQPSVDVFRNILTGIGVKDEVKLKAATTVLKDIAGYEAPKNVNVKHDVPLSSGQIAEIKRDAISCGIVEEATFEDIEKEETVED